MRLWADRQSRTYLQRRNRLVFKGIASQYAARPSPARSKYGRAHPPSPNGAVTTDQAEPSNPHRLETVISTPRVPSLEASGRRPRSQANTSVAGIRNPSQVTTLRLRQPVAGHHAETG